jgi:hypothetical protein
MAIPLAIHPKAELRRIMKRFLQDKDRGISIPLFAELAGLSEKHIRDVFVHESEPLTEYVQRRTSKAYQEWIRGEVAIMQNRDRTKFVQYRKEAQPLLHKSSKLTLVNGEIKINMGIKPMYDYSDLTLDEQLKGK